MKASNCVLSCSVRASYSKSIPPPGESGQDYLLAGTPPRYGHAMAQVETIRGPIDVARLGTTLMHEHVFVLNEEIRQNYPGYWDEELRITDAAAKLTKARERGIETIVDPTV